MTAPDPTDIEPSTTPAWVDVIKELTRPAGCWTTYGLTALVVVAGLVLAYLKTDIPPGTLGFIGSVIGLGWAHAFQYNWARSAEKKVNAD